MASFDLFPPWLAITCVCLLLVMLVAFFAAAKRRAAIDSALRISPRSKRLGLFSLARSDAMAMLEQKHLAVPERLWTYDNFYLEKFARTASAVQVRGGRTALDAYLGPTLSWDIVYAIALGLLVAFFEFGVATYWLPPGWVSKAVLFCACMGLVYGAADVAEDLKLASILQDWRHVMAAHAADHAIQIDGGEAAAANALTRIKMVTNVFSVGGMLIFLVLSAVAAGIYRPPHNPVPVPIDRAAA
jgi:hypothetical protein